MSVNQFYQSSKYYKINGFRKEAIINFIGSMQDQTILNLGCSNGILGEAVKENGLFSFQFIVKIKAVIK